VLSHLSIKTKRFTHGQSFGGKFDYLDEGTLAAALRSRTDF